MVRRTSVALAWSLAVAAGIHDAGAQQGAGEEGRVSAELQELGERLEAINASSASAFWMSFVIGMGVAGFAVLATFWYSRHLKKSTEHLEKQATHAGDQLKIARNDAKDRLRAMLSWADHDGGRPIIMTGYSGSPQAFMVRVVNSGEAAAVDIIVNMEARIVGSDGRRGAPVPSVVRMGSLEPHKSMEVAVPASAETLARAMAGETAYVEVTIAYSMGGAREFRYRVAGYCSNTMSFLFKALDEEVAPCGTEPEVPAGAAATAGEPGAVESAGDGILRRLGDIAERGRKAHWDSAPAEAPDGAWPEGRQRAKGADPEKSSARRKRGLELHRLGRHAEALEELRRAEELDRADTRTLHALADVLGSLGRYEEELNTLGRILEREEGSVGVNMRMAGMCVVLGHYDAAYSALSRAYAEDRRYDVCMDMAAVCMVRRQYKAAAIAFDRAIHARQGDPDAHYGKGVAQLNHRCDEEALSALRRAAEVDPGRADAHVTLAHALHRLGRRKEAVSAIGRAVEASPDDQRVRINAGKIMMDMSRREEAREAFAAARRLDASLLVPTGADMGAGANVKGGVGGAGGGGK